MKATGELLVGEERDVADQPTELRVKIEPVKTLKRERLGLRQSDPNYQNRLSFSWARDALHFDSRPGSPTQGAFEAALATVERRRLVHWRLLNGIFSESSACVSGFWGKSRSF